jgi:hypothetical protein
VDKDRHCQRSLPQSLLVLLCLMGLACNVTSKGQLPSPLPSLSATTQAVIPIATTTFPVIDVSGLLDEVCFEALLSLDGQRLVFLDDVSLSTFYNSLDNYCEEPAPRYTFDFSTQMIVLAAEVTTGCSAEFIPINLDAVSLLLQFSVSGSCNYELVTVYMAALARPAGAFEVRVIGA